ncbi:uncharacterized protein [Miscanthus floridulus]|uniref:uncharacterized protein isoform X3 n=1 Tax=Miscanthus floridulus TaxID=154761 RepID=UPI00345B29AB
MERSRRRGRRDGQPASWRRRRGPSGQPAAWQRRRGGGSRRTGHRAASPGQIRRLWGHVLDPESTAISLRLLSPSTHPRSPRRLHRRPISDNEIRQKKEACYTDVENGLWGWVCRSSPTEKENCVLRCLSPECYDLIYGGDPLEEGELDYVRGQEYKYCMHKLGAGASSHLDPISLVGLTVPQGDAGFIQDKIAELADSNWRVITNPLVELLI